MNQHPKKIFDSTISDKLRAKLLLEHLAIIKNTQYELNTIEHRLVRYCSECNEDKLFCVTCVIPLTLNKIRLVFS